MDLCGLKPQVRQHVPSSSLGIPWTAVDPGKRVGSASGAEGRRFESCRGHDILAAQSIFSAVFPVWLSPETALVTRRRHNCT
jgi:hypothetical protein